MVSARPIHVTATCVMLFMYFSGVLSDASSIRHKIRNLLGESAPIEHGLQIVQPQLLSQNLRGGSAELSVNTTHYNNRDFVSVTVKVNGTANWEQWIGAYSPPDADITKVTPIKFSWPSDVNKDFEKTGEATVTFQMINMRADYVFYFFECKLGFPACEATATSEIVHVNDANAPLKPRVLPSSSTDPTELRVMWSSNSGPESPGLRQSTGAVVQWGLTSGKYSHTVAASSYTYNDKDMCGGAAVAEGYRDIGWIHEATLYHLPAGSLVYYRFGNNNGGGVGGSKMSDEFILKVPLAAGTPGTQLYLYGDMGRGSPDDAFSWKEYGAPSLNTSRVIQEDIASGWGHGVFHIGDISYATGFAAVWDEWLDMISPVAASMPYTVNGGNHENDAPADIFKPGQTPTYYPGSISWPGGDSGGECGVPLTRLLQTPRENYNTPWYSWNIGNIHVIAMNTEYDFRTGSDQYNWIENDLASIDREKFPWVIFGGHRPMYISSTYDDGEQSDQAVAELLRKHLEPLLYKYKVNLAIWGHNHSVQRFCATYQNKCLLRSQISSADESTFIYENPPATIHAVIGTAGAGFTQNAQNPAPAVLDRSVFYRWGYVRVQTPNSTHMIYEFVDNGTPVPNYPTNAPGTVLDRVIIVQNHKKNDHNKQNTNIPAWQVGIFSAIGVIATIGIIAFVFVMYRRHNGCFASTRHDSFDHQALVDTSSYGAAPYADNSPSSPEKYPSGSSLYGT